jgi:undecaprenyl-diphosphatase
MEWSILHTLNDFLYRHDAVEDPLLFYISLSEGLFVATLVLLILFANGERLRPWRRASHTADPGFPSDHATGAFAVAMAIWLRNRRWGTVALLAAALLSVGRVAIGVHFPSDVVAGAALGIGAALLLYVRPIRDRIDRLSDLLGGWYEAALRRLPVVGGGLAHPPRR